MVLTARWSNWLPALFCEHGDHHSIEPGAVTAGFDRFQCRCDSVINLFL